MDENVKNMLEDVANYVINKVKEEQKTVDGPLKEFEERMSKKFKEMSTKKKENYILGMNNLLNACIQHFRKLGLWQEFENSLNPILKYTLFEVADLNVTMIKFREEALKNGKKTKTPT